MIEFLVLRHGQSLGDVEGRHEGRADLPLTDLGREQARRAADWIAARVPPDAVMASPLRRAAETAEILGRRLGLPVRFEDDLMEFDNGELAGLPFAEAAARFPRPLEDYKPHERVPGGESNVAFRARIEHVWGRLLDEARPGQRLAIVAHGGTIAMLFRCFLCLPTLTDAYLYTGDTGLHLWRVGPGERSIEFANRQEHLDPDSVR
jgi:2,3-bisphosphoglycerate-dependent phosphoglycerate mutase